MANRRPELEKKIKELGGRVIKSNNGKVNIIYPKGWLSHPKTSRKK